MKTLHQAARTNDLELLPILIRDTADMDLRDEGVTALMLAVGQSANEAVRLLIDAGADVNLECRGSTPLVFACCQGYAETAAILLEAGAEVNTFDAAGWTPLMHAAFCGWETVLHLLLDFRSDHSLQNLEGQTALDLAAMARQPITTVILRDHGASTTTNASPSDHEGQVVWISETARLLYSAIHGDVETLRELLSTSPESVDLRDDTEQTLLMLGGQNGRYHVVELLLDLGADIEAESLAGRTALMHTVDAGYINTARLLLRRGARPGRRSSADWSALSLAASREDVEMVRMLIEETADQDLADLDYEAALIWSKRSDRPDITALLEGARQNEKAA